MTARIERQRQTVEIISVLRVTLLELNDMALMQASRRSQDVFRRAAERVQKGRARSNGVMLQQALKSKSVLQDESTPWRDRVLEARAWLGDIGEAGTSTSRPRRAERCWRTTGASTRTWPACATSSLQARRATLVASSGGPGGDFRRAAPRRSRKTSICRQWARHGT